MAKLTRRDFLRAAGLMGVGLMAALAGCQPQAPATSAPAGETGAEEGGEPTTLSGELRIASINDQAVNPVIDLLISAHGVRYPEIAPIVEFQVGDYTERMYTQAAAGTLPDVVWTGDSFNAPFAINGVLLDLNPYVDADETINREDVWEAMLKLCEYDGGLYMFPTSLDVVTMYYNKTLFEQAGAETPKDTWTWDDWVYNAKLVTEIERSADGVPQYWGLDSATWNWWATVYPHIVGYGADVINADRTKSTWSDPKTLEALAAYTGLWTEHNVAQPLGLDVGGEAFTLGRAACYTHIPGLRKHHQTAIADKFEWDVQLLPMTPDGKHRTGMGTWGLGVNAQAKMKEVAWEFIAYMLSESTQLTIAKNMAGIPMLKSLANDGRWLDNLTPPPTNNQAFIKGAADAIPPMVDYPMACGGFYAGEVNQAYTAALEGVIRGEKELEAAFKEVDDIIQRCLDAEAGA